MQNVISIKNNLSEMDDSDFGLEELEMSMLLRAARRGEPVTVLDIAVRGDSPESSYFDVKLRNGLTIAGLSGHHLRNIGTWEPAPTRESQYVVTVKHGTDFNCERYRDNLESALRVHEQYPAVVTYETTYPI